MFAQQADVCIIGAGIAGCAVARELSRYRLDLIVVEKECDVAFGQTKASYGTIYPCAGKPGSAMADYTLRGNALFDGWERELGIIFDRLGQITVALSEEEVKVVDALFALSDAHQVPGLRRLGRDEILQLEPHINSKIINGFIEPTAGQTYGFDLAIALAENAAANGVRFFFNTAVQNIKAHDDGYLIYTPVAVFKARYIVNAAGLYGRQIAAMVDPEPGFEIFPYRTQGLITDRNTRTLVNHIIRPAPAYRLEPLSPPRVRQITRVNPTRHNLFILSAFERDEFDPDTIDSEQATTSHAINRGLRQAQSLVPALKPADLITSFAGVSAMSADGAHILHVSPQHPNFVNCILVPPGVTHSPVICGIVVEMLQEQGLKLMENDQFNPVREPLLSFEERAKTCPDDYHIICRCETVSRGQVLEAIRRGANTVQGIKHRTRAGMGRCQGGFCGPRVARILAEELNIPITAVTFRGRGSELCLHEIKELL